jgi:hypothetical protein
MLSALVLTGAIVATFVAAYEWTGLPRHWQMRVWTTALAAMLWLTWLWGTTDAAGGNVNYFAPFLPKAQQF